ncbi:hypothetical protein BMH52_24605 [Pseudomonas sp. BTN1]|nr:hypothetical protein BMH52_24605 [Pseudomonas sp. BTN1]
MGAGAPQQRVWLSINLGWDQMWELACCGEQACLRWGAEHPQKAGSSYAVEREQAPSPQQASSHTDRL